MAEEGSESEQCGATAKGPDANIAKPTTASCLQRDSAADPLGGETLGSTAGGSSCGLHKPSSCSGSCSAAPAIRYDFSQSNSSAFVSFYCRNRKQGDVYVHLTETSLHVSIAQTDADNSSTAPSSSAPLAAASSSTASAPFELAIDQLGGRVVVHECKTNISQMKVEVVLKKKTDGMWAGLSAVQAAAPLTEVTARASTTAVSSGRANKDWNKLEKELEDEIAADSAAEADPLNALFRSIYAKGDEDTRRAMIKSFQTSGGTVLSTNWNEVAGKNYEEARTQLKITR
eukprot:GHVT01048330.1.p1 GENE.GHVT01048330.1~~GHVT01048330.1.p1  ORF type:complete len:287 (+),score=69.38 GHVT01048330.1:614-1474(+)